MISPRPAGLASACGDPLRRDQGALTVTPPLDHRRCEDRLLQVCVFHGDDLELAVRSGDGVGNGLVRAQESCPVGLLGWL